MMLTGGVTVNSVRFEMELWTGAQRAFAVKSFYKNNDRYVAAQREFRKKFGIHRNSKVPSAHAINSWVNNFEGTGSAVKKKDDSVKTGRTPQNVDAVRASFEQKSSPVGCASFQETGTVRKQCHVYFTLGFALRIQEEISRIPVDVLRRAMRSVHDRFAECEQRNDVLCCFVLCYGSRLLIHLFLQILMYVLSYKCNSFVISNIFNFILILKYRPIRWRTLYKIIRILDVTGSRL